MLLLATLASAGEVPEAATVDCAASALRQALLVRAEADQDARAKLAANPSSSELSEAVLRVDTDNTAYMRRVVAGCGWPKRSAVGEEAARAAWLLTQHADMDPAYQVVAAQQMQQAVATGEADATRLALLTDRNRRLTHLPQVYGMQYVVTRDQRIVFHDIVNPGQLEARRKEIGLISFYCWALQQSAQHGGAAVVWPDGVLLQPTVCDQAPGH